MNTILKRERILRQIYKNEKKKEEKEKCKYPAINGLLNENNILTNFIFDSDANNLINNDNNLEVEYDICSYMNNEEIPDLYTPFGRISGDKYQIIPIKGEKLENNNENSTDKKMEKELENKSEENKKNINNENDDNENKIKKIIRYFDIDNKNTKKDLYSFRCKKCGKFGHLKCDCTNIINSCYICLSKEHTRKDCPKIVRCSNCFVLGHSSQDCEKNLESVCENCKITFHKREDCLKRPIKINLKDLKSQKLSCAFCGSEEHVLCPFSKKKNPILLYEITNSDLEKGIDKEMNKKDFSNILYCPNCKGNHLKKECPIKKETWSNNDNKSEIKSFNSDITNTNNKNTKTDDFWGSENEESNSKNESNNKDLKSNETKTSINFESSQDWGISPVPNSLTSDKEINSNDIDNSLNNDKKENNNHDNKTPNSGSKKTIKGFGEEKNNDNNKRNNKNYSPKNNNNNYSYNKNYNNKYFNKNYNDRKNRSNYRGKNYRNKKNYYNNNNHTNYYNNSIPLNEEENNFEGKSKRNSYKYKSGSYKTKNYKNNNYEHYYYNSNINEDYQNYKMKHNK